jgi:hypothetical protein
LTQYAGFFDHGIGPHNVPWLRTPEFSAWHLGCVRKEIIHVQCFIAAEVNFELNLYATDRLSAKYFFSDSNQDVLSLRASVKFVQFPLGCPGLRILLHIAGSPWFVALQIYNNESDVIFLPRSPSIVRPR